MKRPTPPKQPKTKQVYSTTCPVIERELTSEMGIEDYCPLLYGGLCCSADHRDNPPIVYVEDVVITQTSFDRGPR